MYIYFTHLSKVDAFSTVFMFYHCREAGENLKKMLQRYPILVKKCMPSLTQSLQDPKATKESALGSCEILMSRPVIRYLRQVLMITIFEQNCISNFLSLLLTLHLGSTSSFVCSCYQIASLCADYEPNYFVGLDWIDIILIGSAQKVEKKKERKIY